jgi:hypothetical protein
MESIQMTFPASLRHSQPTIWNRTLTDSIFYFMKVILAIPAAGLLLSSALLPNSVSDHQGGMPGPAPMEEKTQAIWAESASCHLNENIVLRFSTPHPSYLGVVTPEGKFFYVVFPTSDAVGLLTPLVDSEKFVKMDRLVVTPATLKADPYIYGVTENQPVFTKSGHYTFIMGDNLHIDDPTALFKVKIDYKHVAKPLPKTEILP